MFDAIARRYDLLNRIMSGGRDQEWRRRAAACLGVSAGMQVLDVATGTADLALAILDREPEAVVDGIDPSPRMLERAEQKIARAGRSRQVRLHQGEAEKLPFPDGSFDAVGSAFGMRNFVDPARALAEMARVTRPAGRVAILELIEPDRGPLAPLARWHIRRVVPLLGAWLSGPREYRYLEQSIARFPPPAIFAQQMREAGLAVREIHLLTFGTAGLFVATAAREGCTER